MGTDEGVLARARERKRQEPHDDNVVTIDGYEDIEAGDEQGMVDVVSNQPVSVAIQANTLNFQLYSGGVFDDEKSCCPSGTTCNVAAMKCEKDGLAMPMGS